MEEMGLYFLAELTKRQMTKEQIKEQAASLDTQEAQACCCWRRASRLVGYPAISCFVFML